jgi:hypothetical protein
MRKETKEDIVLCIAVGIMIGLACGMIMFFNKLMEGAWL